MSDVHPPTAGQPINITTLGAACKLALAMTVAHILHKNHTHEQILLYINLRG